MQLYTGIFLDAAGNPKPSAALTIRVAGTITLATLYDINSGIISNPIIADSEGRFSFRVQSGLYDFVDDNDDIAVAEVQIFDLANIEEWLNANRVPVLSPLAGTVQTVLQGLLTTVAALVVPTIGDVLQGDKDGVNTTYTIATEPDPMRLIVYRNGVRMLQVTTPTGVNEYTLGPPNFIIFGTPMIATESAVADYWPLTV